MAANKHISKIIIALMAAAVVLCFLAIANSDKLENLVGGYGVKMEYESKLFDTDEIISIDIQMDEDTWNKMLSNALSEEYYVCNVVINGKKINNVAIRPKGNTSLSAIAMDPDTDRYSLKLEFDHFVEGQTCYGLDKLILNNNYADATNIKEAIVYDMYQYIGAEASLYNYAEVSVNGSYFGVYLALEGVEESFMLRNFGTQDGELYKPDSLEMGGGDSSSDSSKPSGGFGGGAGMTPPSGAGGFSPGGGSGDTSSGESGAEESADGMPSFGGFPGGNFNFDPENMPEGGEFSFDPNNMPEGGEFSFDPNNMPEGGEFSFDFGSMPGNGEFSFDSGNVPEGGASGDDSDSAAEGEAAGSDTDSAAENAESDSDITKEKSSSRPSGMGGGFSMGNGGANLNYTDDDPDSYTTIWDGEITKTGNKDHKRVVTALKNISEGNDLETYLDVDNVLKYMAVHVFAVNMDSLSGSMAHNYYLYEYDGQLNIFPWDYNLSFGGMSMGSSGSASDMVNDAIDTPFSGTRFFDALLSNEEYLERYHAYLQQLVDEYVNGGRFDEVYNRIRSQIDSLVETDPTAFYDYDEYQTAVEMLYKTIKLRAKSISGQLDGTIPSTDAGQREDSSSLIDASEIDVKAMGQFSMGGGGGFGGRSERTKSGSEGETVTETDALSGDAESIAESTEEAQAVPDTGQMPGNFGQSGLPEGFDAGNLPEGFDSENLPEGFSPGNMPSGGFEPGNIPSGEGFDPGNIPSGGSESGSAPSGGAAPGNMTELSDNASGESSGKDESVPEEVSSDASASSSSEDQENTETTKSALTRGERKRMAAFPGMNGQSSVQTRNKNLKIFGICLAVMLAALIAAVCYKRRK